MGEKERMGNTWENQQLARRVADNQLLDDAFSYDPFERHEYRYEPAKYPNSLVERVIGISGKGFSTMYKVRYKGLDSSHDAWIRRRDLIDRIELIDEFKAWRAQNKNNRRFQTIRPGNQTSQGGRRAGRANDSDSDDESESYSIRDMNIRGRPLQYPTTIQQPRPVPQRITGDMRTMFQHRDVIQSTSFDKNGNGGNQFDISRGRINRSGEDRERYELTPEEQLAIEKFKGGNTTPFQLLRLKQLLLDDIFDERKVNKATTIIGHIKVDGSVFFKLGCKRSDGEIEVLHDRFIGMDKMEQDHPKLLAEYFKNFLSFDHN